MAEASSKSVRPWKGILPVAVSYASTPSDQMSLRWSGTSPRKTSGAT